MQVSTFTSQHVPTQEYTLLELPKYLLSDRDPGMLQVCHQQSCPACLTGQPGVGSRICIFWPTERNWSSGHVAAFDDSEGLSKIQYDDGDTDWLHLAVECYMLPPTGGFLHASQTYHTGTCGLECPAGMETTL